jgi:hypothetical protein
MTDQIHSNVPGWYMAPNAFIDYGMQYLTGDEFKVLSFMTRHIYGWHDKPERSVSQISLSMIENGYGKLGGTGLSRNTIRKCLAKLVEYGFLKRLVGRDETNGAWWSISDSMSFDKLIERRKLRKEVNRKRTAKGRVAAAEKRAREAGLISETDLGLSDNPPPSQSDNQQIKTSSKDTSIDANASSAPPVAEQPSVNGKAKPEPKTKVKAKPKNVPRGELDKRDLLYEAVELHIFNVKGMDSDPYLWKQPVGGITKWLRGEIHNYNKQPLLANPTVEVTPEMVVDFVRRYRAKFTVSIPTGVDKFINHWVTLMAHTRGESGSDVGSAYRPLMPAEIKIS